MEKILAKTFDHLPIGMIMVDYAGKIQMVNQKFEETFGYSADELIEQPLELILPDRFRAHHPALLAEFLKNPVPRPMGSGRDLYGRRKDGTEFPLEIGLTPVESGDLRFVMASVIDISARKQADDLFQLAFEASPSGMLMVDRDGRIEMMNSRTEEIFGYNPGELIGMPVETLLPSLLHEGHKEYFKGFVESPAVRRMGAGRDLCGRHKNGAEVFIEVGLTPVRQHGEFHVLAAVVDIRDRKKAERELQNHTASLERTIKDLDDFAYIASHDLKSPLRAIASLADWVLEDSIDNLSMESAKNLHRMRSRIARMQKLLVDLLEYSRAGRVHGEFREVASVGLLENILRLIEIPAEFEVTYDPELPRLHTLATPLETCLRNLISNGIKHHDRADGKMFIAWEDFPEYVVFVVSDDGPGIDGRFHDKIFNMFQTLKPRDQVEGSGVGLAIIKKMALSYGGDIQLVSAPGEGATFRLSWPKRIKLDTES